MTNFFHGQQGLARETTLLLFANRLNKQKAEGPEEPTYLDVFEHAHVHSCNAVCHSILHLILYHLKQPGPNLAHLLLGFPARTLHSRDIANAVLFRDEAKPSCLQIVVGMLHEGVGSAGGARLRTTNPLLVELCFKLIYHLCRHEHTTGPVMAYLRDEQFLHAHLSDAVAVREPELPEAAEGLDQASMEFAQRTYCAQLRQQAWLFKIIALELYTTAQSRQKLHTPLLDLLFGTKNGHEDDTVYLGDAMDTGAQATHMMLMRLLQPLRPVSRPPGAPELKNLYPYRQRINQIFDESTSPLEDQDGVLWCDIRKMHRALVMESQTLPQNHEQVVAPHKNKKEAERRRRRTRGRRI